MSEDYKRGLGKLYEKVQMIKNFSDMLTVGSAINTETRRREVVLVLKQEGGPVIPLATLLTHEDIALRDYDAKDSAIFERVFDLYEVEDDRKTFEEFNDGFHPKDRSYEDMLKFIDSTREAVEDL